MLGSENLRFIGGKYDGQLKAVAPSAKEIGTCTSMDFSGNPLPTEADTTYTRRSVKILDRISRYEEKCMVDVKLTHGEASNLLRGHLFKIPRVPSHITTQPLKCKITSSLIAGLAFHSPSRWGSDGALDVELVGGCTYRYFDVPAGVLGELLTAPSVGSAYTKLIKGKYACVEM